MSYQRWVFTLHRPTREDRPETWPGCIICIYQLERSPNGSYHYQGYIEFSEPKTFAEMKSYNPRMYIHRAYCSREVNTKYCTKQNTRVLDPESYFETLDKKK